MCYYGDWWHKQDDVIHLYDYITKLMLCICMRHHHDYVSLCYLRTHAEFCFTYKYTHQLSFISHIKTSFFSHVHQNMATNELGKDLESENKKAGSSSVKTLMFEFCFTLKLLQIEITLLQVLSRIMDMFLFVAFCF